MRPTRLYASTLYFLYYAAMGTLYPFLNLYYQRVGLSGSQIGLLAAVPAIVNFFAASVWSTLADRLGFHRGLLTLMLLGATVAGFAFSLTARFLPLLAIAILFAVFIGPLMPLMDSAALEIAKREGIEFGHLRMWGTVGWILSSWAFGYLVDYHLRYLFFGFAGLMALTTAVSLFQPRRDWAWERPVWEGFRQLLGRPGVVPFLLSAFLLWASSNGGTQFLSLYLSDIGASGSLIGAAWAVAAISEVPMLFFSGWWLQKLGYRGFLFLGYLIYAARWFGFSVNQVPGLALPLQLLQGFSFTAFLVGGVTLMGSVAPRGLEATAQALFSGFAMGMGGFAGSLLAGYLYETQGIARFYLMEGGIALVAALILILFCRQCPDVATANPGERESDL